jgi:hypothetical protein
VSKQYWADACTINCVWLFQQRIVTSMDDDSISASHWHTSAVFLTRLEGIEYGFSRHYNYGKYGEDWRLYGVPAAGEIAERLGSAGVNQAYIDSKAGEADRAVDEWQQKLSSKLNGEKNG